MVGILIIQGADLQMGYKSTLGNLISLLSGLCIAITYVFASKIREETENVVYGRSLFLAASLCILVSHHQTLLRFVIGSCVFGLG